MGTVGKLIDRVKGELQSWPNDEQSTTLAQTMGPADATFKITAARGIATGLSPGINEIDQELIFVDSINTDGVTCTIPGWGRGYQSTVAVQHDPGARIISQPTFPRAKIVDEINLALQRVFPELYVVKAYEATTTIPVRTYNLPSDAEFVLDVRWQPPTAAKTWVGVKRWRWSPGGGTEDGDTSIAVDIFDAMIPGRPITVWYAARPTAISGVETQDFEATTGLKAGVEDVVMLATASSMAMALEMARLQTSTIEQQNRAGLVGPSAALTTSAALEQKYQLRLAEEHRSLVRKYPPRIQWSRI